MVVKGTRKETETTSYSTGIRNYFEDYVPLFKVHTTSVHEQAWEYFQGILSCEKGKANMERVEEKLETIPYHQYQHFLSNSPWSSEAVLKQVSTDTSRLMEELKKQSCKPTGLIIDESSHLKKGKKSVGVARQYAGVIGKVDNCQVGVYASLCNETRSCLIDERLFLPKEWIEDEERCEEAGIPKAHICYKTKPQLALEIVDTALANKVVFDWIGGDGLYGHSYELGRGLDERKLLFVLDVHKDQHIYLIEPLIYLPDKKQGRGRTPSIYKSDEVSQRVDKYTSKLEDTDWEKVKIRKTTKGWLYAWMHCKEVWIWDSKEEKARKRVLIIRKTIGDKREVVETKYSLSNGSLTDHTVAEFAYFQAQRYWVERNFDDAKNDLGMSDYQVRKWKGWHHHHAIVFMAMLFLLKEQLDHKKEYPLMSLADARKLVVEMVIQTMIPAGQAGKKEINRMNKRHIKRKLAIDHFYRKQQLYES